MQLKLLYYAFIACSLAINIDLHAMKRKHEEEKEKEKGSEEQILGKEKKRKLEQEQQLVQGILQEKSLEERAQNYLTTLMQIKDEQALNIMLEQHFYEPLELKDYLTNLINTPNIVGETPLHDAKNKYQVHALFAMGANPNIRSHILHFPFDTMLFKGNIEAAEAVLEILKVEPLLALNLTIFTTLHYAIMNNAPSLVRRILANPQNQDNVADVLEERNIEPEAIALIAAALYCPDCIKDLIAHGGNINLMDLNGIPLIVHAARTQPPAIIEMLIQNGADPAAVDTDDLNILAYAVDSNNYDLITYLVDTKKFNVNVDPQSPDYEGEFHEFLAPLGIAVENYLVEENPSQLTKIEEIIHFLVQRGARVNTTRSLYQTPLFIKLVKKATENTRSFNLVRYFVEHAHADVNIISFEESEINLSNPKEEYPLAAAIFTDYDHTKEINQINENLNYELINYLIAHGAKIRQRDLDIIGQFGNQTLREALAKAAIFDEQEFNKNIAGQEKKLETPMEIEETPEELKSPKEEFEEVSRIYQPLSLKYQITKQFITNFLQADQEETIAMQEAYQKLIPEMKEYIRLLVNEKNSMNLTLLHNATTAQDVEKLLLLGADPAIVSKTGQNAFSSMLIHGNNAAAEKLLELNPDESLIFFDKGGLSTLHYALIAHAVSIARRILDNPANKEIIKTTINELVGRDPGVTPLILATLYCPELIELLIQNGAEPNLHNIDGVSPLLFAANKQPVEFIKLLIKYGANLEATNHIGDDALYYAVAGKNIPLISYLVQELKFDPNIPNDDEEPTTAFEYAIQNITDPEYHKTIEELLKYGGDTNTKKTNLTIIIPKAYAYTTLIKEFIHHGADVNYTDGIRYPLAEALFLYDENVNDYVELRNQFNYDLIAYLIEKGALIEQKHKDIIMKSQNKELINLIKPAKIYYEHLKEAKRIEHQEKND